MKIYKLGDKINVYKPKIRDEYIDNCINFITLYDKLKLGDKIWLIQSNKEQLSQLVEVEFLGFIKCEWQDIYSNTKSCQTCKGYLRVKHNIVINQVCTGHTLKTNSGVYKIKNENLLLEDDLFEI